MPNSTLVRLTVVAGIFCGQTVAALIEGGTITVSGQSVAVVNYSIFTNDNITLVGSNALNDNPPYDISSCLVKFSGDPCQLASPGIMVLNHVAATFGGVQAFLQFSSPLSKFTPSQGIDNQTFTDYFTASGILDGFGTFQNPTPCQLSDAVAPGCSVAVSAHGVETLTVRYTGESYYVSNVTYNIEHSPEPSTIFLLTTGVLAITGANRWLRRKQRS